jgi:EAL domain-containing protein (putative c-di-GMP-specific phosphodiesterase class I)
MDAASERLEESATRFAAAGYRLDQLRAGVVQAGVESAGGGAERCARRLPELHGLAIDLGARLLQREVEDLARSLEVALDRATPSISPDAPAVPEPHPGDRLTIVGQLRHAVRGRDQFLLEYQPKVTLASGRMDAVEALLRWHHPRLGLVPPDRFIPVAEQVGLIRSLTALALDVAADQLRAWHHGGHPVRVGVNLSVHDLDVPRFAELVGAALARAGVAPGFLCLEITEGGVMSRPQRALETLRQLKELGVVLAVDDFGIGQSSLAYLRRLPVDEIKIDKSFCLDLDDRNLVIVRSAVTLGHELGLTVTAEGVETKECAATLLALGCDVGQGMLFGRPAAPADLTPLLTTAAVETH